MDIRYDHRQLEPQTYKKWERSGFFNPDNLVKQKIIKPGAKVFSMVLPPPNVTGTLHMGGAFMLVIEDIMTRFARMKGRKTLWLPGTDHAAIATQAKVEKILFEQEGKTRFDLGKAEFLRRVKKFAKASHDTMIRQMKAMGASLDWSREAYTLDKKRSLAVRTAFQKMYEAGLIYRGHRIVNWDPYLKTTVSDDEIEWKEQKTPLYYLRYGPFIIATARPETKFGDKYVVVHPADKRYSKYQHREKIKVNWINGPVRATIIKDKAVDPKFGTGAMTITPWHDNTDFEIAERHNLEKEQIIDFDGKLLPIAGEFAGLPIRQARSLIVEKLKKMGLLVKIDPSYINRLPTNSRGGGVIEPQIMRQWFVDVDKKFHLPVSKIKGIRAGQEITLKELMSWVVKSGQIKILPARFEKIYFHWINNLRDWCISRQIWFGHQLPVWYRDEAIYVGVNPPKEKGWRQDPDTLDTWFSSGLWTFSTLGWPTDYRGGKAKKGSDLAQFHPTTVLETGYDILFFWVARMILMTGFLLGDIPFRTVYLHGLVRDETGKKMSKSLDNILDPLEMINQYGADAVRMSLIVGTAPGSDSKISEDKIRGYRNFTTKIWNAARFVILNYDPKLKTRPRYSADDRIQLKKLAELKKGVAADLEAFRFHRAAENLYHYFWHNFADKIIEASKPRLRSENLADRAAAQTILLTLLRENLKMLHPFMPYVTEAVWQLLPTPRQKPAKGRRLLMIEKW